MHMFDMAAEMIRPEVEIKRETEKEVIKYNRYIYYSR